MPFKNATKTSHYGEKEEEKSARDGRKRLFLDGDSVASVSSFKEKRFFRCNYFFAKPPPLTQLRIWQKLSDEDDCVMHEKRPRYWLLNDQYLLVSLFLACLSKIPIETSF